MRLPLKSVALVALLLCTISATATAQWTWTPQTGRFINIKQMPRETPELQVEYARSLLLAGDYARAWRETEKFDQFYSDTDMADRNQFLKGEIRLAQGRHLDAAQQFQQVITAHPDTGLFDEAIAQQYAIGDALYDRGQDRLQQRWRLYRKRPLRRAVEVYGMVVDNQPFTPAAAEAQYKMGRSRYALGQYVEAAFEYRRVIEDYSGSPYVPDASFGLAMAYSQQALPPAYDQSPSELTVNAVEDFSQRFPADPRTAELAGVRSEMEENMAEHRLLIAQFYERRRQFDAAKIYYEIVRDAYPNTAAANQARAWIDANPGVEGLASRRAAATGGLR